jgi:hypothetical protein
MRFTVTFALIAWWVVMLGLLIQKQAAPAAPSLAALPAGPGVEHDEWFGLYRNEQKLGHAHRVTRRNPSGYSFAEESSFALVMLGTAQPMQTRLEAETDASFALRRFRFQLVSKAASFSADGEVKGNRLLVHYGPEGRLDSLTVPLTETIYLPGTLRPRVLAGDLTPGTRYTMPVFSPITLKSEPMTVTIEGRETMPGPDGRVEAVRIYEEQQGVAARAWIATDGTVVREQSAFGFNLVREPYARAVAGVNPALAVDLVAASRIPLDGQIADPRGAARLTLRASGPAASRVPDDPPRQRVDAGIVRITREEIPATSRLMLPATAAQPDSGAPHSASDAFLQASAGNPFDALKLAAYAEPSPFVESDDPDVMSTARAIVGDERDAAVAAKLLVRWVYEHVAKEPSVTVPSAREVLRSRRGDCNEHAVLLTALARAAGIPARVVAGAVYAGDGFYYHAWSELWVGAWISADAVFDQMPTDATHVKLVDGGPERHTALAGIIGELAFALD